MVVGRTGLMNASVCNYNVVGEYQLYHVTQLGLHHIVIPCPTCGDYNKHTHTPQYQNPGKLTSVGRWDKYYVPLLTYLSPNDNYQLYQVTKYLCSWDIFEVLRINHCQDCELLGNGYYEVLAWLRFREFGFN